MSYFQINITTTLYHQNLMLIFCLQDQWCSLLCAAKEGYADVCIELLDNGADIEHKDMVAFSFYKS